MFRLCMYAFLLSITAAVQVHAQIDPDECPTAPRDLLAGLDGVWSVKQGAGVMIVPVMGALPLPSHAPLRLTMAYDPNTGTSQLTGSGPDEHLVMFPTHESLVPQIQEMVSEADKAGLLNIGDSCDWYGLPLMVGTNSFSLYAPATSETGTAIALALPEGLPNSAPMSVPLTCLTAQDKQGITAFLRENAPAKDSAAAFGAVASLASSGTLYVQHNAACNVTPASSGDLLMTLLVKFQSPTAATGMLIFEMNQNGLQAIAKAPVTMSR